MGTLEKISIVENSIVSYKESNYTVKKILDLQHAIIQLIHGSKIIKVPINELSPPIGPKTKEIQEIEISTIDPDKWRIAKERFKIIQPIIENNLDTTEIKTLAKKNKIDFVTIYRWVRRYNQTGSLSSLVPFNRGSERGNSRLNSDIDLIINKTIEEEYLTKQKKTVKKTYDAIVIKCLEVNIKAPSFSTVRRRIDRLTDEFKMRHRYGKEVTRNLFEPLKKKYDEAKTPLQIVQIDHTPLDIIVVDEKYRKPLHRPWMTLAIDVYSRMVVGFYISLDPPGYIGTGMCLAHAILPKDMWLEKLNINSEWPCWGVMRTIHADNAKEFRGNSLKRVAEQYHINLEWREVKRPNWGGHIERYLGTLLREIHALPGTTFSNPKERKTYNSEKQATLTLDELEKWVTTFIVNVYHKRIHTGIGTTPLAKYNEGILGTKTQKGIGIPKRIFNERKVKLDFMPYIERSVQEYGIQIDHIHYYSDVLRPFINSMEENQKKSKQKRKFIFKRDPRDISVIYFYHPDLKQYFEIPYRDTSKPPITIWEYKEVERWLTEKGREHIDENAIFEGYKEMREIEERSKEKTRKVKRTKKNARSEHSIRKSLRSELKKSSANEDVLPETNINYANIKPYEEIDHEPFT